jgi:hypothetical protein
VDDDEDDCEGAGEDGYDDYEEDEDARCRPAEVRLPCTACNPTSHSTLSHLTLYCTYHT